MDFIDARKEVALSARSMKKEVKRFKSSYIIVPIAIGLAVIAFLFYKEFDPAIFTNIQFSSRVVLGLLLAFLCIFGRDFGLMLRYRLITDRQLTWRQVFRVNMLCEFASTLGPTSVGGSALIMLFLNREGVKAGKSTVLMITCLFMDELFLVIFCPIILLLFPFDKLFGDASVVSVGIKVLFFITYACIALWTLLLYIALFKKPHWVQKLLLTVFRLPFLKRWYRQIQALTENLIMSSREIGHKPFSFWLKVFGTTCFSWCSRFLVVNALLFGFSASGNYLLAFARQFVIWIMMLISPTPGSSGISEYMFNVYYSDFFPVAGISLVVAFIWRIVTYYLYMIIGVIILPGWIKNFKKK